MNCAICKQPLPNALKVFCDACIFDEAKRQQSLAAMPCSVAAPQSDWQDFTPEYDYVKKFYDVLLPSGEIVEGCWPNAGYMNGIMQRNGKWSGTDGVKVRLSLKHPMDDE